MKIWIILLVLAFLLVACDSGTSPNLQVKCPDGRIVDTVEDCNLVEEEPELVLPEVNRTPVINQTPEVNESEELTRNSSTLRKEFKNETNITGTIYSDLNGWSVAEIVTGMASYNENFRGIIAVTLEYDRRDNSKYSLGSSYKKIDDPFWIARHAYAYGTKQYDIHSFRVDLVQSPYEFYNMVETKHNDSKFKIVYPDQWVEWNYIQCKKIQSCRNIEAIKCDKGEHTMYMWTHNTPGIGYTEATRYTMQALDDDKETLKTFEEFYCTPI